MSAGIKLIMIHSQRPKYFSTKILITLFLMLQIVACSGENATSSINGGTTSGTDNTGVNTSDRSDSNASVLADIFLSWTAPSERADNTPISLSEIAGYKVYYGTAQKKYTNSVNINDGTADSYTFKSFSAGTYYFALTTYDTEGRESKYSTEVKIVV